MLDVVMLVLISRHIASIAKRKNCNATGYVTLLIFTYIGLVICGMAISFIIDEATGAGPGMFFPIIGYLMGIAGSIALSYLIVCSVSPLKKWRQDDEYDDEPRSRRSLYEDDDDDYYDRPRSRRRAYDDDDDYPSRRRRRDEYEDW